MADKQITNPTGAFGYTDLQTKLWASAAPFAVSAAVSAKRVVAIGTDGTVATAATNGTAALAVGITQEAASTVGESVNVITQGIAEDVPCSGAVAAGALLIRSTATAGWVIASATPAAGEVIGVAINASSGGTVDVWVCKAP